MIIYQNAGISAGFRYNLFLPVIPKNVIKAVYQIHQLKGFPVVFSAILNIENFSVFL